jgi:hypothetical protein
MLVFGTGTTSRGCHREWMQGYVIGRGAFLSLPDGQIYPTVAGSGSGSGSSGVGPWAVDTGSEFFITGVTFAQKEKYHIVQCFNDRNYTYAFGHDPLASLVEVQFTVFLVNGDNDFGSAVQTLVAAYKANRLSARPEYATLTLGKLCVQGFVVGMQTGTMDPHFQTQSYTVFLLLVEAQDG